MASVFSMNSVSGNPAQPTEMPEYLERNPIIVTALNQHIGYMKAAEIAKRSYLEGKSVKQLVLEENLLSEDQLNEILVTPLWQILTGMILNTKNALRKYNCRRGISTEEEIQCCGNNKKGVSSPDALSYFLPSSQSFTDVNCSTPVARAVVFIQPPNGT